MYARAEIGYDTPEPFSGGVRPGTLARRLVFALIVGLLAGAAIMLQVRGWGTLATEAGGACGSSDQGMSYGACPRGVGTALTVSFVIGIPTVIAAVALVFRKGWARRGFLAVGVVGGLFAGQALFGVWHGTDLSVAWVAPYDSSSQLTTVGAWGSGGSLIRVRVDEAVSYDAATGARQWTLPMPGVDVACAVSGTSSSAAIALIAYGQDATNCNHVLAVNLGTGRQIWSDSVQSAYSGGNFPTGALAVAGNTSIVLTEDGIAGVSATSGAQRWALASPNGCSFQQLAASSGSVVALAACTRGYDVDSVNPATGKTDWRHHVAEPSNDYQFQILSASPVVTDDDLTGPRGTSTVRVFGPTGSETSAFSVSAIPVGGGTATLNTATTNGFAGPAAVADGTLVGVTGSSGGKDAIVGYRLADGKREWLVDTPDAVNDAVLDGSEFVFVDESNPAYSLEEVGLATGTLRSLGFFSQGVLQSGESGLFAVGGDDLVVNTTGDSSDQSPVAAIKAPAAQG